MKRFGYLLVVLALFITITWSNNAQASWFLNRYYGEGGAPIVTDPGTSPTEPPDTTPTNPPDTTPTNPGTDEPPTYYGGWARYWLDGSKTTNPGTPAPDPNPAPGPVTPPPTPEPTPEPAPPSSGTLDPVPSASSQELEILRMVNEERAKAGLPPYTLDLTLTRIARMRAQDLVDHNVFSHTTPTYGSVYDMLAKYGISYIRAGENLGTAGNIYVVHYRLMNSSGHKRNILHPNFNHIGIGVVPNGGGVLVCQVFVQW